MTSSPALRDAAAAGGLASQGPEGGRGRRTGLRVGVVGVGTMGADHARRLASRIVEARLSAVADPDVERAQALADELGGVGGPVRAAAGPLSA